MPARRRPDQTSGQTTTASTGQTGGRKVWKKKTPLEVFLAQEQKLRQEVEQDEEALAKKREQLKKFEQAREIFESS